MARELSSEKISDTLPKALPLRKNFDNQKAIAVFEKNAFWVTFALPQSFKHPTFSCFEKPAPATSSRVDCIHEASKV